MASTEFEMGHHMHRGRGMGLGWGEDGCCLFPRQRRSSVTWFMAPVALSGSVYGFP